MKSWMSALAAIALLGFVTGCPDETEPGGPGADPTAEGENETQQGEATFTLALPSPSVDQGQQVEEVIGIDRGDEFTQAVMVKLMPPAGVTVQPAEFTFDGDVEEQKIAIIADVTAIAGDHKIGVTGTPATGTEVKDEIEITVNETDEPAVVTPPQDDPLGTEPAPPSDLPAIDPPGTDDAPATDPLDAEPAPQ